MFIIIEEPSIYSAAHNHSDADRCLQFSSEIHFAHYINDK